jgi:hypothetical protein
MRANQALKRLLGKTELTPGIARALYEVVRAHGHEAVGPLLDGMNRWEVDRIRAEVADSVKRYDAAIAARKRASWEQGPATAGPVRRPTTEPRFAIAPGGAIIDLAEREREGAAERQREQTLEARRQAEREEAAAATSERAAFEQARAERHRREAPPGLAG